MKPRYTILSFNFGGYDILREPKVVDPQAEYIFVTDRPVKSSRWKVVIDPKLVNRHPVYSSYYVRYHPFEYASTDTVITVDASIQINDSLAPIVGEFLPHEYAVLLTNYRTDEMKMEQWLNNPPRISQEDAGRITAFVKKVQQENWRGSIGRAFIAQRNTPTVNRFNRHVWRYLLALGKYGVPNRQDEIIAHKLLNSYMGKMDLLAVSVQLIQSSYMTYCVHKTTRPVNPYKYFDQYYYLCNRPVSPVRFDRKVSYPRTYRFKTEAILLTKYMDVTDLVEWLEHHLNTVGFEHVHVMDNGPGNDLKGVCDSYNEAYEEDKVSYQKVYGHPRQYRLYDAYINGMSAAEWVMPIDDDEYLDIGDFNTVYDAICYYRSKFPHMMMLGVRWKHLFPKKFHTERTGNVLEYCTEENPELATKFMHLGDRGIKTIVNRYGEVHYEETWENPAGGHVPKHTCFLGAVMCDGTAVLGCGIPEGKTMDDERIRLLHCRYKGYSEWLKKSGECRTVCDSSPRPKPFEFNKILERLD